MWYMIYLLTAIVLTPGGSSTVHIYTQTIHRTTQLKVNVTFYLCDICRLVSCSRPFVKKNVLHSFWSPGLLSHEYVSTTNVWSVSLSHPTTQCHFLSSTVVKTARLISNNFIYSILIGTDRVFRNVGIYKSDAGELPKRKQTIFIYSVFCLSVLDITRLYAP